MIPLLSVWHHARVVGWDGHPDTVATTEGWPVMDAVAALTERWPTDAHSPGYQVPGGDPKIPRLTNATLAPLIDAGAEPVIGLVFVDVDRPDHATWPDKAAEVAEIDRLMDAHGEEGGALDTAGVYGTRAGFRLVFRLQTPVAAATYRAWMRGNDGTSGFLGHLSRATGLPIARDGGGGIDPTCAEWTRCYRLPYVVRDGRVTDPYVDLSRFVARACTWQPREAPGRSVPVPTTGQAADGYQNGIPPMPGPGDISGATWAALADHPLTSKHLEALRTGAPLAKKGSRDTTLIRLVGATLVALRSTDALDAWRVLARSVGADVTEGAPTLIKLWEKCRHFASRERDRAALGDSAKARPPIVYSGSRYWVLDHARDTYRPPIPSAALCAALEQHGPPGLVTRGPDGVPRKTAEYLADYSRPATRVIAEMGRERTEYSMAGQGTLREACCTLVADVPAVFHSDVAAWLGHLGGDDHGILLDWLATLIDVMHPTAALYVEGKKSTGKGMLASGIAALWGTGPVSYVDATAAFNGALADNPIVHIDEGVAVVGRMDGFSAAFRSLIGETMRALRRKFMEAATIVGCPRVIITANNADALRIRERLTANDVEAVADRIIYLAAGPEAAVYLAELGGRTATWDWVRRGDLPGKIAEHVLWLRANRQVTPGTRFLVHGRMTNFHRDMAITSGINGDLLAVLATAAEQGAKQPGVIYGEPDEQGAHVVLVNAPAVRRMWAPLLHAQPPGDADIAGALRALATGQRRVRGPGGQLRFYEIPAASVLRIAELLQIGDPDVLEKRLTTKDPAGPGQVLPMARTGAT